MHNYLGLETFKGQMEDIKGAWNGDERGIQEDNYGTADEILGHIKAIEELLEQLK